VNAATPSDPRLALAQEVANRLAAVRGVVGVALGGSLARGEGRPDSDIDLGIYYRPEARPDVGDLRALAAELDDSHATDLPTDYGGWGPWIIGGAWLTVRGQRVDWIYRDLDLVARVVDECLAGRPALHHQPGHPHGFHTHIYLGELHHALVLHDPKGALAGMRARLDPYPAALKEALVRNFLWQADFALATTAKPAERGDALHVAGSAFQCVAALVQVLFALNEQFFVNEKGALAKTASFPLCPAGFAERAASLLACLDGSSGPPGSVAALTELCGDVRALAEPSAGR
jgi:predicted nucleotidyltransferase